MEAQNYTYKSKREEITFAENEKLIMSIVGAFGILAEMRDNEAGDHIHKTKKYVEIIGRSLINKRISIV